MPRIKPEERARFHEIVDRAIDKMNLPKTKTNLIGVVSITANLLTLLKSKLKNFTMR